MTAESLKHNDQTLSVLLITAIEPFMKMLLLVIKHKGHIEREILNYVFLYIDSYVTYKNYISNIFISLF